MDAADGEVEGEPGGEAGWEDELKREIHRLRGEVAELRESKSQLLAKLSDVERRRSLDKEDVLKSWGSSLGAVEHVSRVRSPEPASELVTASHADPAASLPSESSSVSPSGSMASAPSDLRARPVAQKVTPWAPGASPKRLHRTGVTETAGSVARVDRTLAGVAAMVLGIALGLTGGTLMGNSSDQGAPQVAAASTSSPGRGPLPVGSVPSPSTAGGRLPGPDARSEEVPSAGPAAGSATGPAAGPLPEAGGTGRAIPAAGAVQGSPLPASASWAEAKALDGPVVVIPLGGSNPDSTDEGPGHNGAQTGAQTGAGGARVCELPLHLADLAPEAFRVRRSGQVTPCAFAVGLADPERRGELLHALGPCIGAHGEDGAPTGTHRVGGVNCCAHHAFVERMTRASRDASALRGIIDEARVARDDGQIPPLLRLRAERSALQFLRRLAGTWASAGIDDGSMGHRWTSSNSDPARVRMASWIRLDESGKSYEFEMEIELSDGARGDILLAFEWAGANPLGVLIRTRAEAEPSRGSER